MASAATPYNRGAVWNPKTSKVTFQQLREQLEQTLLPSSHPTSSDPPQALAKRTRSEPTWRRPDGQRGHEGHAGGMGPFEQVDVVVPVKPEHCPRCQQSLQGEDPQPQRYQVSKTLHDAEDHRVAVAPTDLLDLRRSNAGLCRTIRRHAGVDPPSNVAARAIRPCALWRKGSFGTHSPEGSRFVEAIMTVVAQHRYVLDYMTAACEAPP